jgi:hypothetical protein
MDLSSCLPGPCPPTIFFLKKCPPAISFLVQFFILPLISLIEVEIKEAMTRSLELVIEDVGWIEETVVHCYARIIT